MHCTASTAEPLSEHHFPKKQQRLLTCDPEPMQPTAIARRINASVVALGSQQTLNGVWEHCVYFRRGAYTTPQKTTNWLSCCECWSASNRRHNSRNFTCVKPDIAALGALVLPGPSTDRAVAVLLLQPLQEPSNPATRAPALCDDLCFITSSLWRRCAREPAAPHGYKG